VAHFLTYLHLFYSRVRILFCVLSVVSFVLLTFDTLTVQGEFYHWVDLFNHFEVFFEQHVKSRKDLQLEGEFLEGDGPFPKEAVLQVLRVTRIILENCVNKYLYSSNEVLYGVMQRLHSLLLHSASTISKGLVVCASACMMPEFCRSLTFLSVG